MSQLDGEGNRAPEQLAVAPGLRLLSWLVGSEPQRPHDALIYPVRTLILSARAWRLISAAPGVDVLNVVQVVDHLVA